MFHPVSIEIDDEEYNVGIMGRTIKDKGKFVDESCKKGLLE